MHFPFLQVLYTLSHLYCGTICIIHSFCDRAIRSLERNHCINNSSSRPTHPSANTAMTSLWSPDLFSLSSWNFCGVYRPVLSTVWTVFLASLTYLLSFSLSIVYSFSVLQALLFQIFDTLNHLHKKECVVSLLWARVQFWYWGYGGGLDSHSPCHNRSCASNWGHKSWFKKGQCRDIEGQQKHGQLEI